MKNWAKKNWNYMPLNDTSLVAAGLMVWCGILLGVLSAMH